MQHGLLGPALDVAACHWDDADTTASFVQGLARVYSQQFAARREVQVRLAEFARAFVVSACVRALCGRPQPLFEAMCAEGTLDALPILVDTVSLIMGCDVCRVAAARACVAMCSRLDSKEEKAALYPLMRHMVRIEYARNGSLGRDPLSLLASWVFGKDEKLYAQ